MDIIHKLNRSYNESKLITFEDKLNWIAINDISRLKGKCADKILLHQYSKRILKKDICNKILKIYDDPYKIFLKSGTVSNFELMYLAKFLINNKSGLISFIISFWEGYIGF